ncbi:MFS transporter [Corynebacterium mastitidis]|uniref:MFS transporter n=1 Tax=Corynebacterium mastitidis TaxID=161890 RepID=A0ABU8NW76_9CORY
MLKELWPFILGSMALGLDAYVLAGLVQEMSHDLGTTVSGVGMGVTVFTAAYALAGPLMAGRAARRPRRNLTLALCLFTAGNVATLLAPGIAVFLASRLLAGAAAGVYSPLSSAVAATMKPERKGQALSLVLAGLATGSVLGVPLGLLLAEHSNWRCTIGLIAALGALSLLGITRTHEDSFPSIQAPGFTASMKALARRTTALTVIVTLLTGMGSLGLYTYIQPLLQGSSLSGNTTTAIWVWGCGGAIAVFAIGKVLDSVKSTLAITAAIVSALALVLLLIGSTHSAYALMPGLFLWGALGWSSLAPQQHTLLSESPDNGATAVAANASANYLGSSLGSAAGAGLIAAGVTGQSLALWATLPLACAVLVQLFRMRITTD